MNCAHALSAALAVDVMVRLKASMVRGGMNFIILSVWGAVVGHTLKVEIPRVRIVTTTLSQCYKRGRHGFNSGQEPQNPHPVRGGVDRVEDVSLTVENSLGSRGWYVGFWGVLNALRISSMYR